MYVYAKHFADANRQKHIEKQEVKFASGLSSLFGFLKDEWLILGFDI